MEKELDSGKQYLDESTKWMYAEEKGVKVFALYGVGDGTETTTLYAVGGKMAAKNAEVLMQYVKEETSYDGDRKALDALLEGYGHSGRNGSGNFSDSRGRRAERGNAALYGGSPRGNGGRTSGRGSENQRKVKEQFSLREPVERLANRTASAEVLFADKKRAIPLLRSTGLTIASQPLLRNGYVGSITYRGGKVNIEGVPFSSVLREKEADGTQFSLRKPVERVRDLV